MKKKLLFILKRRTLTTEETTTLHNEAPRANFNYCLSSGLRNSARFVVDMLNSQDIEAKLAEVIDNNCIDREVTQYQPTHVVIEAFWVVPDKFNILQKLHPTVKWIIRNHSDLPFLANEGIAIDWSIKYLAYDNVYLAPNSYQTFEDTKKMALAAYGLHTAKNKVIYLPNYYPIKQDLRPPKPLGDIIDVGCFGAIRPLKNQLIQAVAAVHYAKMNNKKLRFHINVARLEDKGNVVLRSIRGFFTNLDPKLYQLVEHGWHNHEDFIQLVRSMDIGLQASFTETFNIVAADFVSQGVPIVVSDEIFWMPSYFAVDETDAQAIYNKMEELLARFLRKLKAQYALSGLRKYNEDSVAVWTRWFS